MENQNKKLNKAEYSLDDYISRLLHSNVIGIFRCDLSGRIFDANDALLNIIGYTRAELTKGLVKWTDITPPEFRSGDQKAIGQLKAQGHAPPWQKEYIHRDGHRVPITIGVTTLDDTGNHVLCYVIDNTEQRQIQNRLADSERQFELLAETIPQLVWSANPGGKTQYANKRYIDYTGVDPTGEDGFAWMQFIHPDDLPQLMESAGKDDPDAYVFETEVRFRRKEGDFRWHLVRGVRMDMLDGTPRWFGTCTDIDDQKRIESELRDAVSRFTTLAEAIPQIVWAAKPDGEFTFFNHRWYEYSGLSVEQSLNGGWQLLIHPEDRPIYMSGWEKAQESGDTFECKFRLKRAVGVRTSGGGYREHLCRAVALRTNNGGVLEWFGTWTDIHE